MSTSILMDIQQQITRIGYPICIIIGNISSAIGLFVFFQKSMRQNPCGLYLIVYMIINLLYINFTILLSALNSLFQINPTVQSFIFCRIFYYISFILAVIPSYLLAMASVDRSFASSPNAHVRLRSTRRFATLMIVIICIFWSLFHLHAFFTVDIQLLYSTQLICTFLPGFSTTFVTYYNLICVGVIPVSLMIGFGIRILMNTKRRHINHNQVQNNRRRLILLLIIQVSVYISLRLPASLYLTYKEITKSNAKTFDQVVVDQFFQSIVYFCQFLQVTISPLLNLTTRTFRNELKQAFIKILRKLSRVHEMNTTQIQVIPRHEH